MNTDELVEAFIALRTERDRMRNEWEEKDGEIVKQIKSDIKKKSPLDFGIN